MLPAMAMLAPTPAGRRCNVGRTFPLTFFARSFCHESDFIYTKNFAQPSCGFYLHKLSGQTLWRIGLYVFQMNTYISRHFVSYFFSNFLFSGCLLHRTKIFLGRSWLHLPFSMEKITCAQIFFSRHFWGAMWWKSIFYGYNHVRPDILNDISGLGGDLAGKIDFTR